MSEHPILFSGPMVQAILEGRKTQTRRVIKKQPQWRFPGNDERRGTAFPVSTDARWAVTAGYGRAQETVQLGRCPYGIPGDKLWVRENWAATRDWDGLKPCQILPGVPVWYLAGQVTPPEATKGKNRPSIHMPRWACRVILEVTEVRVERVQEISEEDAKAEGARRGWAECPRTAHDWQYKYGFMELWDSINKKRGYGWEKNLWVRVVKFNRVEPA